MQKRFDVAGSGRQEEGISASRVMQLIDQLPADGSTPLCVFRVKNGEPAPRAERQKRTRNTPV